MRSMDEGAEITFTINGQEIQMGKMEIMHATLDSKEDAELKSSSKNLYFRTGLGGQLTLKDAKFDMESFHQLIGDKNRRYDLVLTGNEYKLPRGNRLPKKKRLRKKFMKKYVQKVERTIHNATII